MSSHTEVCFRQGETVKNSNPLRLGNCSTFVIIFGMLCFHFMSLVAQLGANKKRDFLHFCDCIASSSCAVTATRVWSIDCVVPRQTQTRQRSCGASKFCGTRTSPSPCLKTQRLRTPLKVTDLTFHLQWVAEERLSAAVPKPVQVKDWSKPVKDFVLPPWCDAEPTWSSGVAPVVACGRDGKA